MSRRQDKKEDRRLAKVQAKAEEQARRLAAQEEQRRVWEARDRVVTEKLQRFRGVQARNAELERLILEAPDDQGRWAVYVDWLQSQGDIRGELAARDMCHARELDDVEVSKEEIWSRFDDELWDSFGAQFQSYRDGRNGAFQWHLGFIKSAMLCRSSQAMASVVSGLSASCCGRFVRTLALINHHRRAAQTEPVVQALGDCPTLDALYFVYGHDWVSDMERLFDTVPSLKTLYVTENANLQGVAPNLTNLRIDPDPSKQVPPLRFLDNCSFPALQRLELRAPRQTAAFVDTLSRFLEREDLPQLRHLTISRTGLIGPNVLRALREALPRLEYLDGPFGIELPELPVGW